MTRQIENPEIYDRALGSFIGLAVGDALGAPAEFKNFGEYDPITEYTTGGVWNLPKGYWTDDTSMAICLAKSILETGTVDHINLLEYFTRWWLNGENSSTGKCFDIGNTTRQSIHNFNKLNMNNGTGSKIFAPADDNEYLSGNGSIMRLAPVPIKWYDDMVTMKYLCIQQSITTHGSKECQDSCVELGTLISDAINGKDIHTDLIKFAYTLSSIPNSGRALDTMIAAKWAVGTTSSFKDAVLKAVNIGGDTDTIGAVTGQIAGAMYGYNNIPKEWCDGLYKEDELKELATLLFNK